ncbi:MAG: glutamate-1-semialdehyde 2,1-aminomutase [Pseudomonadota bacterium]
MTTWQPGPISRALLERARKVIPGGVNSPVRAFRAVGGEPYFVARAQGPYVWDVDGNQYIDYIGSWGPMILGHADPGVLEALQRAMAGSTSFGAPSAGEVELAELVCQMVPSVEVLRLVNSGTEATMSAVRLARAATGRPKMIKFEGCYHGHGDMFLIKAGSGAATFGQPDSPGITEGVARDTLNARYNDLDSVRSLLDANKDQVAAIIVEPVVGNMGCVPPVDGFLRGLRSLCDQHGCLLIFDEVMTGFRVHPGCAQSLYGVKPDLTTLGKVIGGGLPVGAYGGRADLMMQVSPAGPMYQAGTLSGNPLAVAAGLATLRRLHQHPELFEGLEARGAQLATGLAQAASAAGLPHVVNRVGSMFSLFLVAGPVHSWDDLQDADRDLFSRLFQGLLRRGVSIAPSAFEAGFLSTTHTPELIVRTLDAYGEALREAAAG